MRGEEHFSDFRSAIERPEYQPLRDVAEDTWMPFSAALALAVEMAANAVLSREEPEADSGYQAPVEPPPIRRPTISKSLRFAVFKRDSFTCQYCGRRAPEVVLHCDHVKAVAEGGATDALNLVTACSDCNLGKGARNLSDNAVISKQVNQLAALEEKRQQLDMMLAWRDELDQLKDTAFQNLVDRWKQFTTGFKLTDTGKSALRKLVKKYGVQAVAAAMKEAADNISSATMKGGSQQRA